MLGATELNCDCCNPPTPPPPEDCQYFADDFEEGSLDPTDWTLLSGTYTVGSGMLSPDPGGMALQLNASELSPMPPPAGRYLDVAFSPTTSVAGTCIIDLGWTGVSVGLRYTVTIASDGDLPVVTNVKVLDSGSPVCSQDTFYTPTGDPPWFLIDLVHFNTPTDFIEGQGRLIDWPGTVTNDQPFQIATSTWTAGLALGGVTVYDYGDDTPDCPQVAPNCFYCCGTVSLLFDGVGPDTDPCGVAWNKTFNSIPYAPATGFTCRFGESITINGVSVFLSVSVIYSGTYGSLTDPPMTFIAVGGTGSGILLDFEGSFSGWLYGVQTELDLAGTATIIGCDAEAMTCKISLFPA